MTKHKTTHQFLITRVENAQDLPLPSRATISSAGMDLYANITEPTTINPMEFKLIPAGIKVAIPKYHEIQVRPRSGLAVTHGINVVLGTIDEDYRGEIGIILINHSTTPYTITRGDRIAQMVLTPISYQVPVEIDEEEFELFTTDRGDNGFGSTGIEMQ